MVMESKEVIVGFGTGRCGTKSLAHFLNNQADCFVTHEGGSDLNIAKDGAGHEQHFIGDVGHYWIQSIDVIVQKYPDVYLINITRDDDETVKSFLGLGSSHTGHSEETIRDSIKHYREQEKDFVERYRVFHIDTYDLNNEMYLHGILDFIEYEGERDLTVVHTNRGTYNVK